MRKYQDNVLEKHRKLQALDFDWNPTGRIPTSDVQRHRRKKVFEENLQTEERSSVPAMKESDWLNVVIGPLY